jgi:hypothetical protein
VLLSLQANALLGIGKSDAVFSNRAQQQQTDVAETESAALSDSTSISTVPAAATPAITANTIATAVSTTDRPLTYREEMQNGVAALARQRIQGLQGGVVSLFSAVVGQRTVTAAAASTPMIEQAPASTTSAATSALSSSAHGTTATATDSSSSSTTSSGAAGASSGSAMTAETVTALSKKLTHAEMRGIIGLTDRLKRMSQSATQSQVTYNSEN